MKAPSIRPVRCAVYTRVSTEYGLDQEFNSLDAQYDAASAYIKSQAHAGWTLTRSRYDTSIKGGELTDTGINKETRTLNLKFARVYPQALFHVYLDARGPLPQSLRAEQNHLNNTAHLKRPNKNWPFRDMQFLTSHESQGIQVADILLGALTYRLNGHYDLDEASPAKIELSNYVLKRAHVSDPFRDTKHLARYTIWHRDKPWLKPMLKGPRT